MSTMAPRGMVRPIKHEAFSANCISSRLEHVCFAFCARPGTECFSSANRPLLSIPMAVETCLMLKHESKDPPWMPGPWSHPLILQGWREMAVPHSLSWNTLSGQSSKKTLLKQGGWGGTTALQAQRSYFLAHTVGSWWESMGALLLCPLASFWSLPWSN